MDDTTQQPDAAPVIPEEEQNDAQSPSAADEPVEVKSSDLLCLATCSKCADEGARGACSKDKDHRGEHKCNRCSHTWFG